MQRQHSPQQLGPRGRILTILAAAALTAGALSAAPGLQSTPSASASEAAGVSVPLPAPDSGFSYQLGGPYAPEVGMTVVSRDRTAAPAGAGHYSICYVNLLQTQPDEDGQSATNPPYGTTQWWIDNHPGLLLKDSNGDVLVDAEWNEALFDVSTATKRSQLLAIQKSWFQGCKDDGFQAIEPDNLDSYTRSGGVLSFAQTKAYLKLVVPYVHGLGLAIAQKNASDGYGSTGKTFVDTVMPAQGFDFAIAEECAAYSECGSYTSVYGSLVFEIEYTDNNPLQTRTTNGSTVTKTAFDWICTDEGAQRSIILRDRDLTTPAEAAYVHESC